jgi:hypothetical protein
LVGRGGESFDRPWRWEQGGAGLISVPGSGLDDDRRGAGRSFSRIAAIGKCAFHEARQRSRHSGKGAARSAISDIGRARFDEEDAVIGIDQNTPLAAFDRLAGAIETWSTGFGRLTHGLEMIAADGTAARPPRSRSVMTSAPLMLSKRELSRQHAKPR